MDAASSDAYDAHRISLGIVDSTKDMEEEKTLLLEANFEALNGVSFAKGCYVGQEQTARTKHRATIRNVIYPVRFDGATPEPGTPVIADGKEIGQIRSTRDDLGMARLRVETVEAGTEMTAGGTVLTTREPQL